MSKEANFDILVVAYGGDRLSPSDLVSCAANDNQPREQELFELCVRRELAGRDFD